MIHFFLQQTTPKQFINTQTAFNPLKCVTLLNDGQHLVPTYEKTVCDSINEVLVNIMFFLEIAAIYCEDHVKRINRMWQNTEFRSVTAVTILFKSDNTC